MLADVTTTLDDVQAAMQKILPEDAILVGHSLNCDLMAMKVGDWRCSYH
jgi:RNA exonuclease 1